jgi:hypothetical protein
LNIIKQNIISLEQLTMNQLEQFFKRSNFNDLKPFSCSSCGAGYGSAKTLKKHMSDKHGIKVTAKRGKKQKEQVEEEDDEDNDENDDDQSDNLPKQSRDDIRTLNLIQKKYPMYIIFFFF